MIIKKENIPNALTFIRILIIPILMLTFFLEEGMRYITCGLFVIASITDYFDGYLSRKWQVESKIGALMDPIADKLLVTTVLALLIDVNNAHIVPAVGIMCREIFVSGLREFLSKTSINMPVTKLAKWKTASQMLALIILILSPMDREDIYLKALFVTGYACLWIAFILTIYTGWKYYSSAKEQKLL